MIARGFQNTCTIVLPLAGYAASDDKAPLIATQRFLADLAEYGMFSVYKFTRDYKKLSFDFEDAVILLMDLVIKCEVGFVGLNTSARTGLDFYTNREQYWFEKHADLLKWAIPQELREMFELANAKQTVCLINLTYEAAAETSNKRFPLFLQIKGILTGISEKINH